MIEALVIGVSTATALFVLIIGGSLICFLFKAGLICAPKHNNVESPPETAERGRRRDKKTFSAQGAPKFQEKHSPHPTMGGVFPPSTLLSAEEARRRKEEPRTLLHRECPQASRRPILQPLMEAPTPSNLVLPSITRTPTPPASPGPYTPIQIERHPYAQTRGYGSP